MRDATHGVVEVLYSWIWLDEERVIFSDPVNALEHIINVLQRILYATLAHPTTR
jgi:hypothetical protein